jgi:hypothetical protein
MTITVCDGAEGGRPMVWWVGSVRMEWYGMAKSNDPNADHVTLIFCCRKHWRLHAHIRTADQGYQSSIILYGAEWPVS